MKVAGSVRTLGFVFLMALFLAMSACKSSSSGMGDTRGDSYYGTGHPDRFANEHYVEGVGYGNQRGHLNDRGRTRPPEPKPPEPVKPAPPAPVRAEAPPAPRVDMTRCTMAFPTGDRATSAILLETTVPGEVRAGQPYDYEMRVTNISAIPLENVMVKDTMTGGYTMSASNPPASGGGGADVAWNLGKLNAGESKVIRVTGAATGTGTITRCATVDWNSTCCVTTRVVQPALQLTKTAPAEVLACEPIEMSFTVTNSGTGAARNVRITDNLPDGLMTADGQRSINMDVGTLETGQSATRKIMVKAAGRGTFQNTAQASAEGGLTANSNTTSTLVRQPVLTITKSCKDKQFIGREIDYEINVSNSGDGNARDCFVEDMLPAGTRFVRASDGGAEAGGKVTWNVGTLAPGASKKLMCTVAAAGAGQLRNVASVRAYCADPKNAECSTSVEGIPAILLEVIDIEDPIEVGKDVVYVIEVTNQGSAVGTNIVIGCGFEQAHNYLSATGATAVAGGAAAGAPSITFQPLPTLAPKQKASWRVTAKAAKPGDIRFKVTMKSDQIDRNVEETEATRFY